MPSERAARWHRNVGIPDELFGRRRWTSPELLYLPTADVPAAASPTPVTPRAHTAAAEKPQPTWFAQWRAEWATAPAGAARPPGLTLLFGVMIVCIFIPPVFHRRIQWSRNDPEIRSRVVKIDIAIVGVSLPVLAIVLGVPSPLVQGLVGVVDRDRRARLRASLVGPLGKRTRQGAMGASCCLCH